MAWRKANFTVLGGLEVMESLPDKYSNGYLELAKYGNKIFVKRDAEGNPTVDFVGSIPTDAPRQEFTPEETAQIVNFYEQKKAAQEAAASERRARQAEAARARLAEKAQRQAELANDFDIYD